ncbi:acyltransferase family protein [Microbacterium amylolyticum]|uniref:Peptidoglycan/LPS O-acetylase OafA/YrhL n=1 Tax=Microbacterium amylolyticum TaxID=936337 RepID=A0ABS4ZIG9_9MICO|nr:acyltransferase [Microbacterium amylolyticum]MBP2437074.1 peptidoglycan/LPS O-acetylase OafA/YrhL [Microbacterium amylolyticum]
MLVAVFHIWFNRVSGGVDVFFTIAGFLVTATLLSQTRRFGHVRARTFFGRLAMRLLPQAAVVLGAVLVLTIVVRPYASWRDGFLQILASASYWENWFLAFNSVDYLAVDTTRSPVQHFWAMSIQGQFYVIWFVLFLLVAFIVRRSGTSTKRAAVVAVAALIVVSFVWSVLQTGSDQQFAYFSTLTRVWEFGLGSLLALTIDKVKLPAQVAAVLSWIALIAVVTVGAVLPVADLFPGYVALIPVVAACLIIVTGQQEAKWGGK